MKKRLLVVVLLTVALVGLVPPQTAQAEDVFRFSGDSAFALFSTREGCIRTLVSLSASDQTTQDAPGAGSALSLASVFISVFDFCTGTDLIFAFGGAELADAGFQVAATLDSATLNTTIGVLDLESGSSFNVDVAMSWTGSGDVTREPNQFHLRSPGLIVNVYSVGASRDAVASGTVIDPVTNTNFTPGPSLFAGIFSSISGQVAIRFD
jgi:hypothetical protein